MSESGKFRILCIDGGGLRGVVPLQVIKYIETITGKEIHKIFDLIAGTSTGGLLTCALTLRDDKSEIGDKRKYSINEIENIYTKRGREIFPFRKNIFSKSFIGVNKWFRPQFSEKNLNKVLLEFFNDKRITNCLCPILITSFDIHRNRPVYFTTREASFTPEKNSKLIEICKATSAAPTYFPTHNFKYDSENIICIDGGIVMNNPTIGALVEVLGNPQYKHYRFNNVKALSLNEISILSLGTGRSNKMLKSNESKKWGRLKWIKPVLDISISGPVKITHQQIETIFKSSNLDNNYLRIDIDIEEQYAEMSDSREEVIQYLLDESKSQILENDTLLYKLKFFLQENGIETIK